jgi:GH15 family glucan-1,4-alpha-glucosidase
LPETPGGDRNYDYRFSWIRDATFALWGMYSLGFDWEAVDFFSFIADLAECDDDLQIMYGIGGERDLTEHVLDHLPGYAESRPVRIGNAAYAQRQHDVWGALLDSVYLHSQAADHLDNRIWPILDKQVSEALKHWREPDAGIWEVRGELKHFTSSKIMCWVAVDRGARLAKMSGEHGKAAEWELAAAEIKDDILSNGVDDRGVLVQYYGGTALDASLLLAPLLRFLPPDDPRVRATVLAIRNELTVDGWCSATRSRRPTTGSTARRAPSRSARSGWSRHCARSGSSTRRASSARNCSRSPDLSSCTARRSTHRAASTSATSPRHSPTSPSSTPSSM